MAGNVKGITIEFRGETTKLDRALRQINTETRALDKELRQVDNALKFNPTNVELWKQKQQLLTQKINETKEKLSLLKDEQARMDAAGVDKNSAEYRKLQREIIETESKVKTFEGQLKKIGNVKLQALGNQFQQIGSKLEAAGEKMRGLSMAAAGVVTAIGAISYKAGKNADDINTMSKKYHIGTKELQMYSAAAELVDVDVETIAKSHTKLTKSMNSAVKGTGASADAFDKLGVSITDSNGNLRDADDVWQDTIKALGKVENETERDALAMQLMGKAASDLNPLIEDGGEAYENLAETMNKYDLDFLDQETLDKANEFNDELDTMKAIGSVALQTVGSKLAAAFAPALQKATEWVGKLANWISKLNPRVLQIVTVFAAVLAALAPVLIILGKLSTGIGAVIKMFGMLTGPVGIAIVIIGALVAAGILLYKNWDTIKAKATALFTQLKTTFNNIKTAITTAWNNIKTNVSNAVDAIKTKITNTFNTVKSTITNTFNNIKTNISNTVDAIKTKIANTFDSVKTNISNVFDKIKTTASTAWNNIKSAITTAIGDALNTVKDKISTMKTKVSETWSAIKEKTSSAWSSIKEKITGPFESAKEKISSIISTIKGWFPISIGNIFKGLKTPHFSLQWSSKDLGKLGTISYPTGLGVSWYKTGGIFDSPSVIGVGEAGAEAVVPLDKLWDKLDNIQGETNIVINVNGANKDPREIAEEVRRVLIRETNQRRLAWQ